MRLTISRLPLATQCLYHARPDAEAPRTESSVYAAKGNAFDALVGGADSDAALAGLSPEDGAEVLAWWEAWQASDIGQQDWDTQTPITLNPHTGEAWFLDTTGRDYSDAEPGEIPGTADLVRVEADRVVVCDTKTGLQAHTAPAASNRQLHGYALALCRIHGLDAATVIVAYVDADGVRTDSADLDAFDLHAIEQEMAAMLDRAPRAEPMPGLHCREQWCPALAVCPATHQAVQLVAPGEPVSIEITSHPQAEAALARVKAIRSLCDAVEDAAKAFADAQGGVQLSDGRVWARQSVTVEPIDLDGPHNAEAIAILAKHGADSAIRTKVSVSKTDVEAAIRGRGGKVAPTMRELMNELRAIGATKPYAQEKYEARKPKSAA